MGLDDQSLTQGCTNTLCLSELSAVLQFTNLPIYQFSMKVADGSIHMHLHLVICVYICILMWSGKGDTLPRPSTLSFKLTGGECT